MPKDDRIFRVTKHGRIYYKSRHSVSAMFGTSLYGSRKGRPDIVKVEAANAEATSGWTDVTEEFRNPKDASPRCPFHKTYTGVRKPTIWGYTLELQKTYWRRCTCTSVYCENYPEYPSHLDGCELAYTDPKYCPCQVTKKLLY